MKDGDWKLNKPTPLIAHVFDAGRRHGVDIHLSASSHQQALDRVERKLKCCGDFLRASGGQYEVRFERELEPG